MKTKGFSIGIIFLLGAVVCTTCTKDEDLLSHDEENSYLKGAQVKSNVISVLPSGDVSGATDNQSISDALQNANPGDIVILENGVFYLHKSIVCWDFSGTLKGAGKNKTIIQTSPGIEFDVSEDPPIEWADNWVSEGHAMFSFPHHYNNEMRTVTVSDLTIIVNEPSTEWGRNIYKNPTYHNTLAPVSVYHEGLDKDYSNTIRLDVYFKNLAIIGEEDPQYTGPFGTNFSIVTGLGAAGASAGEVVVKNVQITNATFGLGLHVFNGESSTVTVFNTKVEKSFSGIYSAGCHTWNLLNNQFKDMSYTGLDLEPLGLPNQSAVIQDNLFIMDGGWIGIFGYQLSNARVRDNTIQGTSFSGILVVQGANWEIKDNELCDLTVSNAEVSTIRLFYATDCVIKDNAGQVVAGPSASDPTNYIGNAKECNVN